MFVFMLQGVEVSICSANPIDRKDLYAAWRKESSKKCLKMMESIMATLSVENSRLKNPI